VKMGNSYKILVGKHKMEWPFGIPKRKLWCKANKIYINITINILNFIHRPGFNLELNSTL
jgi:hypothetical protein